MHEDIGQELTWAKIANLDTILVATGTISEICDFDDRGCRTQLVAAVDGAHAMFEKWGAGVLPNDMMTLLHRVVYYGDHLAGLKDMGHLLGLKVLREGQDMVKASATTAS